MKFRTRLITLVVASLLGMLLMALIGLYQLRQNMMEERRLQIAQLLDVANAQLKYFNELELSGKLTHEEAQSRAKESISAQRTKDNYFIVRDSADGALLVHGNPSMVGKKTSEGRQVNDRYLEEIRKSSDGKGFVMLDAARTGSEDKTRYKKLNGASLFQPWGWLVAIGFFVDDIEREFWNSALIMLLIGGFLISIVSVLALRTLRGILSQLGGEPAYAVEIAQSIASGDLSRHIEYRGLSNNLLGSIRVMKDGLHQMVEDFHNASSTLAVSSQKLSEETEQISRGSQMIADATSSTAAAIEEMTVSISHISESARQTEENSRQAADLATLGEKQVNDAAVEIRRISTDIGAASDLIRGLVDRSREIDGMSVVIKDIADQTNLLALNAAIEAARAGVHGRGFAVVADEVRKLAERTSCATQDITRTIRAVQHDTDIAAACMGGVCGQVALGVDLTEKAAQALRAINEGACATLVKTRDVADAAQEQSQASSSIANNIERISQMVEHADVSVQSAHGQVRQLEALTQKLNQAAAKFKL